MKEYTILFLRKPSHILLAMKKRGYGEGKWNGIGGKVKPDEAVHAAAIRECEEEISVTPMRLTQVGDVAFLEADAPREDAHHASVFVAEDWKGEPKESEEMRPQWFRIGEIPFDEMWSSDRYWLPLVIHGKRFTGSLTFDGDVLLENNLSELTEVP